MTWFDVIKRGIKLKPEIIKESIKKIVDERGYFQATADREEFIQNYNDAIRKLMKRHMFRSPEYKELQGHLTGANAKLKGRRPSAIINNYAKTMYKYSLTTKNIEGQKYKMRGLLTFINNGGNIYFKDANEYRKFIDKFIKK